MDSRVLINVDEGLLQQYSCNRSVIVDQVKIEASILHHYDNLLRGLHLVNNPAEVLEALLDALRTDGLQIVHDRMYKQQ